MDDASEKTGKAVWTALLRGLRPAVPAVIGAAALTFLFAAVMPLAWVAGISWNLYLDRLSDLFLPPIGNGGRLAMALGMAAIAAVVAGIIALMIAEPEATGVASLRRRMRRNAETDDDMEEVLRRRRVDLHPDDPPRPPIRAGRDLPAEGLGPVSAYDAPPAADEAEFDLSFAERAAAEPDDDFPAGDGDELVLADLAPEAATPEPTGDEPWLQPAELAAPIMPDPADKSLGAMVARFEAGLARRRQPLAEPVAAPGAAVTGAAAVADEEPEVDFALEAALSTLQRMTRSAVG